MELLGAGAEATADSYLWLALAVARAILLRSAPEDPTLGSAWAQCFCGAVRNVSSGRQVYFEAQGGMEENESQFLAFTLSFQENQVASLPSLPLVGPWYLYFQLNQACLPADRRQRPT